MCQLSFWVKSVSCLLENRFMTRKLYSFAAGQCAMESPDNIMFHEALLSGHLYQMVLKVSFM